MSGHGSRYSEKSNDGVGADGIRPTVRTLIDADAPELNGDPAEGAALAPDADARPLVIRPLSSTS
jgi:hypothetical protein